MLLPHKYKFYTGSENITKASFSTKEKESSFWSGLKGACKSFLHHNNNKRPKKLKNQQLLLNSVNCGHRANHWPQTRDGYRKSQLTLSRSPHIETSSGNWARAGENLTATEGLPEAQSRQKLRTEHSRGAHTL